MDKSNNMDGCVDDNPLDVDTTDRFNEGVRCDVIPPASSDPQDRFESFRWKRPPEMEYFDLSASAKLATALTLEDDLRQRDLVIRLLAKQLRKSNEEKYRMLEELKSYRGSDRQTLYHENCVLRQRIDRVTKENLCLRGLELQRKNSKVGVTQLTKAQHELPSKRQTKSSNSWRLRRANKL